MIDQDPRGWLLPTTHLSLPQHETVTGFQSIKGMEYNTSTGEVRFLLKQWSPTTATYKHRFTLSDLSDMLNRNVMIGRLSLDGPNADLYYHPFNQMRFSPSSLHGSEFLHTMFLADYLLKFLTTGSQVQALPPYAMRPLDDLIRPLPPHLKKIITDFHNHQTAEESAHRFWIEIDDFPITALDEKKSGSNHPIDFLRKITHGG